MKLFKLKNKYRYVFFEYPTTSWYEVQRKKILGWLTMGYDEWDFIGLAWVPYRFNSEEDAINFITKQFATKKIKSKPIVIQKLHSDKNVDEM